MLVGMAVTAIGASGKILHNSYWYGLETAIETVVFLGTSVAVARYLGPEKLGHFAYINYLVQTVTQTSGSGLASGTRKFMSEFLALDKPGSARAVYQLAYRYQLLGAILIAALGLAGVALLSDQEHRTMSAILVLAIVPGVMCWVPAQANNAFEDVSKNTIGAFGYILSYASVIVLALHFHWDLVGIASASLIGRCVEVLLRTIPVHAKLRSLPLDAVGRDLAGRVRKFCVEAVGIQLLMSIVWGRSEMLFLGAFCAAEQAGFYAIGCGLADKLQLIPRTFGGATGITLMVESTKDATRVYSMVRIAARYLLLAVLPVNLGVAAITAVAIHFFYGPKYDAAVAVLIVAAVLSIPRAFQEIPEVLLRTADRQRPLLKWYIVTGVLNLALDAALIPHFGAIGAAWGNGISQTFGVCAIWQQARKAYTFSFPTGSAVRLLLAAASMAGVAFAAVHMLPGPIGLGAAFLTAIPTYIALVKVFRALEPSDRERLTPIGNWFPAAMRRAYLATIAFATPSA